MQPNSLHRRLLRIPKPIELECPTHLDRDSFGSRDSVHPTYLKERHHDNKR